MKSHDRRPFTRALAWLLCALLLAGTALPVLTASAAGDTNIARGKRAIACHSESDTLTPQYALDGKESTRYAAGSGCVKDTWYMLDLGDNYDLSRVRINWEAAHPSEYVLELSADGQNFTALATIKNADSGWVETAVSGTGRFLRIREVSRALSQYGFSMWELEVYGTEAAVDNTAAYDYVRIDEVKYGTLNLSREGLVKRETEVTLTVTPMEGGSLASLTLNGEDVTAAVKDGRYTFTVDGDTSISAVFHTAPGNRYECEDALVYAADGKTPISVTRLSDPDASNRATAGGTGGKYFVFENVVEANCIQIAYASTNTNSMNLYIRYPWEEDFHAAGLIPFSTSNSWDMKSSYIATSPLVYIPAGSDVMVKPNVDCNLDCLWLTTETAGSSADVPANIITAADLSEQVEDDIMATYAQALHLTAGDSVSFTVPAGQDAYNVLSFSYYAEGKASVTVKRGSTLVGEMTWEQTDLRTYAGTGLRTEPYSAGDTLTLTCTAGELKLDYVAVNYAPDPEVVTVTKLPAAGERLTVSLDGIWAIGSEVMDRWSVPDTVPEGVDFVNSIPVPGLWDNAAYDMGSYEGVKAWYQKTVVLEEAPTGQVLLYIGAAQYGRYIYVNGQYVGSYEYNYSRSYTDISDYLKQGENELVIMLGPWSRQANNPGTPAHVLFDGESTQDEPGFTDSVSLIFNREPEVATVQTNPNIDKGSVQVQVTLRNRTKAAVTSDVTITIYELGVFENGVANQKEVKVGEYVQRGVKVAADGTTTFTVDEVKLSGWTKDKCWSPDSPFLYRVEIKTSGDTYSTRFGMRTFGFDPVTHYACLNGEIFYMMGTNVAIERYFDDPLVGTTPWDGEWVRKLYSEFRDVNWNCFRIHLGHASELWFDLADEMGLMIFDEYPIWGNAGDDTIDTIMPEIYAWMDARANHPSMIVFDAQNEATYPLTDEIIRRGRAYDLQKRPWDNGWRPPVGENDPVECHPYIIGSSGISGIASMNNTTPIVTTADIGWKYADYPNHGYFINEHGEYWINREGKPMSGTAGTWNNALPGATNEERLTYYAELMAAQVEAMRAGRAYVGMLFFCGLASSTSSAQGVTCDILSPDVSTAESLEIRPYTKELLKNAFADLGIVIDAYTEEVKRGEAMQLPIVLVNDTGAAVSDLPVTLTIKSGDTVLYTETVTMSVDAFSGGTTGTATQTLRLKVPAYRELCRNGATLVVTASYELDGETISSQRKWTVKGGDYTDDDPPAVDTEPADTSVDTSVDTSADTSVDTSTVDTTPDATTPVDDGSDTTADASVTTDEGGTTRGCKSTLPAVWVLIPAVCAVMGLQKMEKAVERKYQKLPK